jgi:hypothetical protein
VSVMGGSGASDFRSHHSGHVRAHPDHSVATAVERALQVLVLGFSASAANETCFYMEPACQCSCTQWDGIHVKNVVNDSDVAVWTHLGFVAKPETARGMRSRLAPALTHISAWHTIAQDSPENLALIFEDDQHVRPETSPLLMSVIKNSSLPEFDMLYISTTQPYEGVGDGLPPHILRMVPAMDENAKARSIRSSAYALSSSGAQKLLKMLKSSPPDLSVQLLDTWIASQILARNDTLRVLVWDDASTFLKRAETVKSEGNVLTRIFRPLISALG